MSSPIGAPRADGAAPSNTTSARIPSATSDHRRIAISSRKGQSVQTCGLTNAPHESCQQKPCRRGSNHRLHPETAQLLCRQCLSRWTGDAATSAGAEVVSPSSGAHSARTDGPSHTGRLRLGLPGTVAEAPCLALPLGSRERIATFASASRRTTEVLTRLAPYTSVGRASPGSGGGWRIPSAGHREHRAPGRRSVPWVECRGRAYCLPRVRGGLAAPMLPFVNMPNVW